MIYSYLKKEYKNGEPIILSEIPGKSRDYIRHEIKKLVDEKKLIRVQNGLFYLPYKTILGTNGKLSIDAYIKKKYLEKNGEVNGYVTGLFATNNYGLTTQNPSCIEICTNEAKTKQRKITIDGMKIIIYKPVVKINKDNKNILQFLDIVLNIDKYSELSGNELKKELRKIIKNRIKNKNMMKDYLKYYPDKIFKNMYYGGVMDEI